MTEIATWLSQHNVSLPAVVMTVAFVLRIGMPCSDAGISCRDARRAAHQRVGRRRQVTAGRNDPVSARPYGDHGFRWFTRVSLRMLSNNQNAI
jgi:hypothetical protein